MAVCTYQLGGAATRRNWRTVCTKDVPSAAYIEAGSFSTGTSLPTVRHVEDDGQRGNFLRATCAFYIHFQVFNTLIISTDPFHHTHRTAFIDFSAF